MHEPADIGAQQIDALLVFLPIFEQPGYSFGVWQTPPGQFPCFSYSAEVTDFIAALYEHHFIIPFDWPSWTSTAQQYMEGSALATADIATLCKLLTVHVRADRFNEGHLAHELERGHITAILQRLRVIRNTQEDV